MTGAKVRIIFKSHTSFVRKNFQAEDINFQPEQEDRLAEQEDRLDGQVNRKDSQDGQDDQSLNPQIA